MFQISLVTMASCILNKIICEVRGSQLNFSVKETPFSLQISIRKTPIKYHTRVEEAEVIPSNVDKKTQIEQQESFKNLEIENGSLVAKVDRIQQVNDNLKIDLEQMKLDRDNSDKCKMRLKTSFDRVSETLREKDSEIVLLKKTIKTLNEEKVSGKSEMSKLVKIVKEKEREIYRLETKADNLATNLKNYKSEFNKIKKEKSALEKELKQKEKHSKNFIDKNFNFGSSKTFSTTPSPSPNLNSTKASLTSISTSLSSDMKPLVDTLAAATNSQSSLAPQIRTNHSNPIMPTATL